MFATVYVVTQWILSVIGCMTPDYVQNSQPSCMAPDSVKYSQQGFIEYRPGDLNVILLVPHGGSLRPPNIPNRDAGGFVDGRCVYRHDIVKDYERCSVRNKKDVYTRELAVLLATELRKLTGKRPHVVLNHLHRIKMDANAEIDRASFGVKAAEMAWESFNDFVKLAKQSVKGRGLLLDLHGQCHPEQFIEVGYTISNEALNKGVFSYEASSIRNLAKVNKLTNSEDFKDLILGPQSFGGLLEQEGYRVMPSPANPSPRSRPYYSGGYNTECHGSRYNGTIDAIQIESPRVLRNKDTSPQYAASLALVIHKYLQMYYK